MKKSILFAILCCAALLFAACNKNDESKEESNNNQNEGTATGTKNGHDWVNLGLSVKWATCNIGADKPEEYGDYYAWGETATKSTYSWDTTYKHGTYNFDGNNSKLTKYNTTDEKTSLEAADDAATVNWGEGWRMPTNAELDELIKKCTWTWTTKNGVKGCEIKATNGNTIFLPAAGYRNSSSLDLVGIYGGYWSSSLNADGASYA